MDDGWIPNFEKAEKKAKKKAIRRIMARLRGGRPRKQVSDAEIREKALQRLGPYYQT